MATSHPSGPAGAPAARRPGAPAAPRPGVPLVRAVAVLVLVIGTLVTVTGTFLPWAVSGEVSRNSYQVAGTLSRLRIVDSALLDLVVGIWPYVGPALIAPLVPTALRWWRAAGVVAALVGLVVAAAAATAWVIVGGRSAFGVSLSSAGPSTVVIGGAAMLIAGVLLFVPTRRSLRLSH